MRTASHDRAVDAYARSVHEQKAPRIHALISWLWERLQVEADESKRQRLNDAVVHLEACAERGIEIAEVMDREWRREFA